MKRALCAVLLVTATACGGSTPRTLRRPPRHTTTTRATSTTMPAATTTTTVPASGCSGVMLSPGANLAAALTNAPSGTTFCLASGAYPQTQAALVKTGDRIIGPGAFLDYSNVATSYCLYGYGGTSGQSNVTVQGLDISRCAGSALKQGDSWAVLDVRLHDNAIGMDGGNCDRCIIDHNAVYGIVDAGTVTNTELAFNGGTPDSGGSTGGNKNVHAANAYWLNDNVHDNLGPGVWCDGCWSGSSFVIDGGTYAHNLTAGVDIEISYGATIKNAAFVGNAFDQIGKSCWWGSDIAIHDSPGVTVTNNTIDASAGENPLCTVDSERTDGPALTTPFVATGNRITLGTTTLVGDAGDGGTTGPHTFQATAPSAPDYWHMSGTVYNSTAGSHWSMANSYPITYAQWQMLGQS